MKKILLTADNIHDIVKKCTVSLKKPGTFLLVPTETVYGLVCPWDDISAKERIFSAKMRPEDKPFQMLAADIDMVKSFGGIISAFTEKIVNQFCPGPLTIVVPSKDGQTIGFRIPKYDFLLELIKAHNKPLAGTSANISGGPPALYPGQVLSELKFKPDITVDAGVISSDSRPSTVIKISNDKIDILREGPISLEEIQSII